MAKSDKEAYKFEMPGNEDEKAKALQAARLQIEKQFGSGSLIKLGDHVNAAGIEVIPSGSILLDEALGIGGYPRGRIIEIFGPESSGKTTLALHLIAEAQKLGGNAAFIDAEHALDPIYAKNLGVLTDELYVSQPDNGEQALEIADSLVRSGALDVIVIDSVAALTPQAEIDGDMGDAQMGLQARLMSQALRKLTGTIGKSRTILVFINQLRMKIGIMFGNPETTTGGNALKFYASLRIDVRKGEVMSDDDEAIGNRVKVKVVKNKVAPPFRKCELEIIYGKGFSATASLLDAAVKYEIIDKKGSWFSYGEEKVAQGREAAKVYLDENLEFRKIIDEKVRDRIFPDKKPQSEADKKAAAKAAKAASAASAAAAIATAEAAAAVVAPIASAAKPAPQRDDTEAALAAASVPSSSAPSYMEEKRSPGRPRKVPVAGDEVGAGEPLF